MQEVRKTDEVVAPPEAIKTFSVDVQIDGQPFVFSGAINEAKKDVILRLHMPVWQEEVAGINKEILSTPWELLNLGEIGNIEASQFEEDAGTIYILGIHSYKVWLPGSSRYKEVHVGRFLMNNLLALADMKGWRVTAFAHTDGVLDNDDMNQWLRRKGFVWLKGHQVRLPTTPDFTQSITKLV